MTEQITTPCQCTPTCQPKTEWVDGLEFVVDTWCKTPQPWNERGSQLDVPNEIEARVKEGIRKVSDLDALQAILEGPYPTTVGDCKYFWGSHGCDLEKGHGGMWHVCGFNPLYQPDPEDEVYEKELPHMAVIKWSEKTLITWWQIDGPREEWTPGIGVWKPF